MPPVNMPTSINEMVSDTVRTSRMARLAMQPMITTGTAIMASISTSFNIDSLHDPEILTKSPKKAKLVEQKFEQFFPQKQKSPARFQISNILNTIRIHCASHSQYLGVSKRVVKSVKVVTFG